MYLTKEPLSGNGKSKFILITDTKNLAGMKIFKTVMKMFSKEQANVAVLCCDGFAEDLLYGVDVNCDHLKLVDAFTNPFGWRDAEVSEKLMSIDVIEERFSDFKGVLCICSLTSLLIHNGVNSVYKTLCRLLRNNSDLQIVALMYPNVHDSSENDIIDKLATTALHVNPNEDKLWSTVHYSSGKVTCLLLDYKISEYFEFTSLIDAKLQEKKAQVKQPDPAANLTFNLRLKDEEIEARSQLQLPYMKMQTSDEAIIQNLLENDFYDEEDPDDDLDI